MLWSLSASTRAGKVSGEVKTAPVSNSSSIALVWLAYTCGGMPCVHFFARSTRATCIQDSIPTRTSVGFHEPSGGGGGYSGSGNNGGPCVGVAIGVGAVGGPGRGVLCNGPDLPEPYPVHGGALWV